MDFRPARPGDDAALLEIVHATWTPVVSPSSPPTRTAFFADGRDSADYRVAVTGGEIVGYVSLHQAIPLPSHRHVLTINGLAVTPAARGRGVGRALVEGMVA